VRDGVYVNLPRLYGTPSIRAYFDGQSWPSRPSEAEVNAALTGVMTDHPDWLTWPDSPEP
jgi:hypothetical protein